MNGHDYTKSNEGCRLVAYQDQGGIWTIGWGHAIGVREGDAWSQATADYWFGIDYNTASDWAADLVGAIWPFIGEVRQAVLIDQAFELGHAGLAAFTQELAAVRTQTWEMAAFELTHSKYDAEVPGRARRNANMLLTGEWPGG